MDEEWIAALLLAATTVGFATVAAAIARARRRREAARDRVVAALLERFGTLPEFVAFARSAEGRALLGTADAGAAIAMRLLWTLLSGAALLGLGLVLLWLGHPPPPHADINLVRAAQDYRWWGLVMTPIAVALLAAVAVAAGMARRWGVIGTDA